MKLLERLGKAVGLRGGQKTDGKSAEPLGPLPQGKPFNLTNFRLRRRRRHQFADKRMQRGVEKSKHAHQLFWRLAFIRSSLRRANEIAELRREAKKNGTMAEFTKSMKGVRA